jgi:hypothetical protein
MSCQFKNLFGEPGTGVHSIRIPILDIALVDTAMTFVLALAIQKMFHLPNFWEVLLWTFIVGEIMHWLFCSKTRVIKFLDI